MKQNFIMQDAHFGGLLAFAVVREELSFTRAAQRLRVSPSAVSQAVRKLEAKVGVPLLVRTSRSVRLTDAGARLLERAVPALRELWSTLERTAEEAHRVTGVLRITSTSLASAVLPGVIQRFLDDNPRAHLITFSRG